MGARAARPGLVAIAAAACLFGVAGRADAQLGSLISPGRLARPHADLEGLSNCQKCHEQGRRVTPAKCLTCHEPVARRIAAKRGVHADAKTDCVGCHVEHAGVDGELRPFDTRRFDHARVAGYPLDGRHAKTAGDCRACHKGRSFLEAATSCASCHADVHKGALGRACEACHTTRAAFSEPAFDHARTAFPLAGAHRAAACEACHPNKLYKGREFGSCADCHDRTHRRNLGAACATCHTAETWRTKKIDHDRTSYPLAGKHALVGCADCHAQPPMKAPLRADRCGACHADIHQGTFKEDCQACHSTAGFGGAPFDHAASTAFALTGGHQPLKCVACHKNATQAAAGFRGLQTACVSCHADVHGAALGTACESCHSDTSFSIARYTHRQDGAFFAGEHAPLVCDQCHKSRPRPVPSAAAGPAAHVRFDDASRRCAACHADVHLGQVGDDCVACHSIASAKFAVVGFSHAATKYPLTGRHQDVACDRCHTRTRAAFPAGEGDAVRLTGLKTGCQNCHADPHAGQIARPCEACHSTATFGVPVFVHDAARTPRAFFTGRHAAARCDACHKKVTAPFPAGRTTAVQYAVDPGCVSCHTDVHRGRLGRNCLDCHKP